MGSLRAEHADAARNRQLLLAAAREIIAGQGVGKLTMDGLAERGLGKGTVFRRFRTRAGILQALPDDDERHLQEQVLSGPPPLGPGALPLDRLIAYGRARIGFLIGHREIARAALDGREPVPAGSQTPMSRAHIRSLLVQICLAAADLDVRATQLIAALDGPTAALPVLRHPHPDRSAGRRTPRPRLGRPSPARLRANGGRSAERRDSTASGRHGPHRSLT